MLLFGCRDFESDKYYSEEEAAINGLFTQFIDLEAMLSMNEYENSIPILYIINQLDSEVHIHQDSVDNQLSEGTIEENTLFKPLTSGLLKKRNLPNSVQHKLLNVMMLSEEDFQTEHRANIVERLENNRRILGYLHLTRIIFNKDFTVGYLGYDFYCGVGCAWNNNIEIRKENGQWIIVRYLSGGIA